MLVIVCVKLLTETAQVIILRHTAKCLCIRTPILISDAGIADLQRCKLEKQTQKYNFQYLMLIVG